MGSARYDPLTVQERLLAYARSGLTWSNYLDIISPPRRAIYEGIPPMYADYQPHVQGDPRSTRPTRIILPPDRPLPHQLRPRATNRTTIAQEATTRHTHQTNPQSASDWHHRNPPPLHLHQTHIAEPRIPPSKTPRSRLPIPPTPKRSQPPPPRYTNLPLPITDKTTSIQKGSNAETTSLTIQGRFPHDDSRKDPNLLPDDRQTEATEPLPYRHRPNMT